MAASQDDETATGRSVVGDDVAADVVTALGTSGGAAPGDAEHPPNMANTAAPAATQRTDREVNLRNMPRSSSQRPGRFHGTVDGLGRVPVGPNHADTG